MEGKEVLQNFGQFRRWLLISESIQKISAEI